MADLDTILPENPDKSFMARNTLWAVFNQSAGQILVLAVFLVTARFVSKEAFGIMAACLLIIEAFRQIAIESVSTSVTAKKDPTDANYNACFIIILSGSVLAALAIFLLSGTIAALFDNPEIKPTLEWVSVLLLTTGLSRTHETWLQKHLQFKRLTIRSLISIGIGGAIGVFMAMHGYGIDSLIAQQIVTSVTGSVFLWTTTSWRPSFITRKEDILELLRYSRHVSLNATFAFLNGQSDIMFSSYYLGSAATGVYNAAKRIVTAVLMMLMSGLNSIALPAMASSDDRAQTYLQWMRMTTFFLAPLYAGLTVLSKDFITLLLGEKWIEAAPVLAVLSIASYFTNIDRYNSNILFVLNKPHWQTMLTSASAVINLVILFAFARYGVMSLVLAFLIKVLIAFPVTTHVSTKLLGISWKKYIMTMLPSLISATVMGLCLYGIQEPLADINVLLTLPLQVGVGAAFYFFMMWFMDRKTFLEIITTGKHIVVR